MELSDETLKIFKILYCEYLSRRNKGFIKVDSLKFTKDDLQNMDSLFSWHSQDISYALQELKKAGFISRNIIGTVTLQESSLKFMQDKPKEFFKDISKHFIDLISLL